jgi:DNA repair exonuclease SbcCD nuclease subunit
MTSIRPAHASTSVDGPSARILHTGDWQLGMTRHYLDTDAQARFTGARIDVIRRLGDLARERSCEAIVVAGDVFETNMVSRRIVVRALEAMRHAGVQVLLLPGNHDPLDPASVYRSPTFLAHRPDNVVVLDGGAPHVLASGVEVIGAPWRTKRPISDLCADALGGLDADGTVRVLVGHGAVDSLARDGHDPARISMAALAAALDDGRVHYVALGDRHSLTTLDAAGRIAYAGAPEPTAFDEVDPGKALVVDVAGGGVQVEAVSVAAWRFVTVEARVEGLDDVVALGDQLDGLGDKDTTIVRLGLHGAVSLDVDAALASAIDVRRDVFAAVEWWDAGSALVRRPEVGDLDGLELVGSSRLAALELTARAGDEGGDAEALDALALLHRLAGSAA